MIDRQIYTVDFLSPVHIGSGQKLGGHEFAVLDGQLVRFDVNRLLERLGDNERALESYMQQGVGAVVRRWSEGERQACIRYSIGWTGKEPREVLEHIADSFGRLYLPGSSLKGAIRTAIVWGFLYERQADKYKVHIGRDRRREWAGQPLLQAVLGADPNHDLLRALRVFDSSPLPMPGHVAVVGVKVAVAEPNNRLTWLRRKGDHVPHPQEAFSTWLECLTPAASGKVQVIIEQDAFLLEGQTEQDASHSANPPQALKFHEARRALLSDWVRRCNAFARHVAEGEVKFGQRFGLTTYAQLHEERLHEMEQSGGTVYLILGWGTGWRTKTVTEAFGEPGIRQVRQLYQLGRGEPFPKTRKVVFEHGQPMVPLGWVRLRPQSPI